MIKNQPIILTIFGISGDLARRYILPAVDGLFARGMLPDNFSIVGVTRQKDLQISDIIAKSNGKILPNGFIANNLRLFSMNTDESLDYFKLKDFLVSINMGFSAGVRAQNIFYLAVPASAFGGILENFGKSELRTDSKLLLEKPFGIDFFTAKILDEQIKKLFSSEQIFLVDHYLAKEAVRDFVSMSREEKAGTQLEKILNKNFIDKVEVVISEQDGIEGRNNFYEKMGALRDCAQNHLLEILAVFLSGSSFGRLSEEKEMRQKILDYLQLVDFKIGQYKGYRDEVGVPSSNIETFIHMEVRSSLPQWEGVKIALATGKALKEKFAEVRFHLKGNKTDSPSPVLFFKIQPDRGFSFSFSGVSDSFSVELADTFTFLNKQKQSGNFLPAYESVLDGAFKAEKDIFVSPEEALRSWEILASAQEVIGKNNGENLSFYPKGTDINELI